MTITFLIKATRPPITPSAPFRTTFDTCNCKAKGLFPHYKHFFFVCHSMSLLERDCAFRCACRLESWQEMLL
jgi:hypothetical protein